MPRRIESLFVNGPAGRLEAILEEPEDRDPVEAALVCHPHPQHGGTMHNKVVYRTAKGLRRAGCVVLRFNYRGVNLSHGVYDHGEGEMEDARAALSFLLSRYPTLPVTIAGFSFGSRITLRLGCQLGYPRRLIAVGFPTIYKDRSYLEGCVIPRYFVQSTNDEFGPLPELEAVVAGLPDPKQLIAIEATDHYFAGGLPQLEDVIATLP
ncbi:MAG: alpha/beta hydrolase [Acidobacteria bacterium]|nr:alpha/beta hydrolase [Acidobacteriota bacterium]